MISAPFTLRSKPNLRDTWVTSLVDTAALAKTLPRVDGARIGLLGFTLGGHLCLRARAAAKPKALVEYFAPVMDGIGPPGNVPLAQIHHGKDDEVRGTEFANAEIIERILLGELTAVTLFGYDGAGHGFAGNDAANKSASALSQTRTLTFFATSL